MAILIKLVSSIAIGLSKNPIGQEELASIQASVLALASSKAAIKPATCSFASSVCVQADLFVVVIRDDFFFADSCVAGRFFFPNTLIKVAY